MSRDEFLIAMGFDAMRVARGLAPVNFTKAEVVRWINMLAAKR